MITAAKNLRHCRLIEAIPYRLSPSEYKQKLQSITRKVLHNTERIQRLGVMEAYNGKIKCCTKKEYDGTGKTNI